MKTNYVAVRRLGAILMQHYRSDDLNTSLPMIETPTYVDRQGYLFSCYYTNVRLAKMHILTTNNESLFFYW